ncbi:MAG: hypothetical protein A2Z16_12435 [Chloroflexi bacterium RBG_16_54_18]|nr:MAG: hypothetical protein A2Z16_12435 [Chloroflexi bacterium RBG_16_54_18]
MDSVRNFPESSCLSGLETRHARKRVLCVILSIFFLLSYPNTGALAQTATPEAPPGFQLVSSGEGVWLFRRDYPNGTPDFVQVVDLSKKAGIMLMYANIIQPRTGRGVYGGDDPRFSLQPLDMFWEEAIMVNEHTFCVSNGSFFYMPETPTRLAFPLKVDGNPITDGFGILTYPGQKLMLELWVDHADIRELSWENLHGSEAPDILGGLKDDANKRAKFAVGRTFVGIADNDHDRRYETVMILNTSTAVQAEAAETLKEFNAEKVMMLDGGGSTQLICRGSDIISSDRLIPQVIAVVEAGQQALSGRAAEEPIWLVAGAGEPIDIEIAITNEGTETWVPGEHQFEYEDADHRAAGVLPFSRRVPAGEQAKFNIQIQGFANDGLHDVKLFWYIAQGGRRFSGNPLDLRIAVLAAGQDSLVIATQEIKKTSQLPADVENVRVIDVPPVETMIGEKVSENEVQAGAVEARNLLWVPLLILPFALVLLALFIQKRG